MTDANAELEKAKKEIKRVESDKDFAIAETTTVKTSLKKLQKRNKKIEQENGQALVLQGRVSRNYIFDTYFLEKYEIFRIFMHFPLFLFFFRFSRAIAECFRKLKKIYKITNFLELFVKL